MADIEAGVKGEVEDELTLQAIQNTTEFETTYRLTMAHTPGKTLLNAMASRQDHQASLMVTARWQKNLCLVQQDPTSMLMLNPLTKFKYVENALELIKKRLKAVEETVRKIAVGLRGTLTNHQSLSEAVAGCCKSLEAHARSNIDSNLFISAWDRIQYFKEKYKALESTVRGNQMLTRDRMARATHDVGIALN